MDKLDFVIKSAENKVFKFQGFDIEILSYIPQDVKLELTQNYIKFLSMSDDAVKNYYSAEWGLIWSILDKCTNINHADENFENIMSSGLWDEIKAKIVNYNELRNDIRAILSQRSVEGAFNKIADKVMLLIDNVSKMDMSKEGIEKLVEQLNSTVGDFQEKFPTAVAKVADRENESAKETKPTRTRNKRTPKASE
jgi:hypothetical protein